jgi:hypothetical protein
MVRMLDMQLAGRESGDWWGQHILAGTHHTWGMMPWWCSHDRKVLR